MPAYLKYKYFFGFISNYGRIRIRFFVSAEPDPRIRISDPYPDNYSNYVILCCIYFIIFSFVQLNPRMRRQYKLKKKIYYILGR